MPLGGEADLAAVGKHRRVRVAENVVVRAIKAAKSLEGPDRVHW